MDFEFSAEERAFEAEVETFLTAERSSDVMDDAPEQLSQTVDTPPKRAFMRKLAERGWLGMSWPKQYGGQERPGIYDFLLTEALSRAGAPQPGKGVGIVGKTIIRHGNETMKQRFLPQIIRGEIEFAVGYSEPQAGSDAANMQLRAERSGDTWTFRTAAGDTAAVRVRSNVHATNGDLLRRLAVEGGGVIVQPGFIVEDDIAAGRLVQVLPDWSLGTFGLYAVYLSRRHLSAKARVFIDYLVEALGKERAPASAPARG